MLREAGVAEEVEGAVAVEAEVAVGQPEGEPEVVVEIGRLKLPLLPEEVDEGVEVGLEAEPPQLGVELGVAEGEPELRPPLILGVEGLLERMVVRVAAVVVEEVEEVGVELMAELQPPLLLLEDEGGMEAGLQRGLQLPQLLGEDGRAEGVVGDALADPAVMRLLLLSKSLG